jgi:hypothetical protein
VKDCSDRKRKIGGLVEPVAEAMVALKIDGTGGDS